MTKDEIIIELARDLYTVRKAYKEEQENSKRYANWWRTSQSELDNLKLTPKDSE